jgi:transaldolase
MYVEELAGPETVNTMPTDTFEAFMDHGEVRSTSPGGSPIKENVDEARALIVRLREARVDYEDVTEVLEKEGVAKFADSFDELLEGIKDKSRRIKIRSASQPVS